MRLSGRLVDTCDLSVDDRRQMFALMDRHYRNLVPAAFEADLAEKQWIIQVVHESTGELCGFSTQMVLDVTVKNRAIKALFSGDTIIDRQHWGDKALIKVGGQLALSLAEKWPDAELYWFLISQGYKTYRFLPVFFQEFYPRYDAPMPTGIREIIDVLAGEKFPDRYDPASGVIRADANQYRLREGVADITPQRLRDPHIQFFIEQNPGHLVGDELCCIAPLARANFTRAAYRVIRRET